MHKKTHKWFDKSLYRLTLLSTAFFLSQTRSGPHYAYRSKNPPHIPDLEKYSNQMLAVINHAVYTYLAIDITCNCVIHLPQLCC